MDLPKISVTEFKEHGVPLERPVEDIPATNEPAPDDLDAELQKHTDHAENGATILMLAHSCRDLLETCVNHSEKNEFVLLRERFLSWASSIDVFSMQSELDVTLRKKPHIHDIFVRFLLVLEQGLKQLSRHIDKPNAIVSDEAECSRIYSVAELYMAAINDSLHSLTRLGVSLVHSSRISETTRARRALAGRRRNELLPYEAVSILVLETLYPQASDHLLRQFANSMMNRYIRHLYRASQQPSSVLSTTSSEAISTVSAMTKETDVPLGPPDSDVPKVDNQPKGSSPEGEPTTAMTQPVRASSDAIISVDSKAFYDGLNIPRPTNSRSPTSVARGNIFGPPLPTFDHLGKGDCEWCFKSIHQSMTDGRKWSLSGIDHYEQDLVPYFCLSEFCMRKDTEFYRKRPWLEHMQRHHPSWPSLIHQGPLWKCDFEILDATVSHSGSCSECAACNATYTHEGPVYFTSEAHFIRHVDTVHKLFLIEKQWKKDDLILSAQHRSTSNTDSRLATCPICRFDPDEQNMSTGNSQLIRSTATIAMVNHIADHLHFIMLLSLRLFDTNKSDPPGADLDQGSDFANVSEQSSYAPAIGGEEEEEYSALSPFGSPTIRPEDPELEARQSRLSAPKDMLEVKEHILAQNPPPARDMDIYLEVLAKQPQITTDIVWGDDLEETLSKNFAVSKFESRDAEFLPCGKLEVIINNRTIKKAFGFGETETMGEEDTRLMQYAQSNKKLFAILGFIEFEGEALKRAVQLFFNNGFSDSRLPIVRDAVTQSTILSTWESKVQVTMEQTWTSKKIRKFLREQWKFCTPSFNTQKYNHDFLPEFYLPFTEKIRMPDRGTYGRICRFEIHPEHVVGLTGENGHGPIVAVKEIIPGDREENDRMIAHWNDEAMALRAMNKLSNDHIVHFITAFRRIKNDEVNLYLMFEWADGGNLRRLWESFNPEPRSPALVQAVVTQITGLAGALSAAHYPPSPQDLRYRHGDLKPENIFWFRNGGEIGKLKIGDWGEAKGHNIGTEFRADETAARFGTRRYEAPEVVTGLEAGFAGQTSNRRSRLYDVWAMGCITLEFLVWLIYGPSGLNTFNHSITGDPDTFYQLEKRGEKRTARVHDIVVQWMDDMAQEPLCASNTTALGNLLTIVRHDLLVVEIKYGALTSSILAQSAASVHHGRSDTNPERGEGRVRSDYFYRKMKGLNTYRDDVNRFPCPFRDVPMALCNLAEEARKEFPPRPKYQSTGEMVLVNGEIDYAQANVVVWNHRSDNISARYVLWAAQAKAGYNTTNVLSTARLCEGCQEIRDDIWRLGFSQVYVQDELRAGAEAGNCDLHRLFWDTCVKNGGLKFDTIRFHNHNSTLRMNSGAVPVLSIVRDQDTQLGIGEDVQVGLARLPQAGSEAHIEIVRQWLRSCDETHTTPSCKPPDQGYQFTDSVRPTRLLAVGDPGSDKVRLYESQANDTEHWIALSHQWGPNKAEHYSTNSDNVDSFMVGMNYNDLPGTFKDAVTVTRALGIKYLWIDSLCIIQAGPKSDFEKEAKLMEMVYSSAYCVIAASRAAGHGSGFLQERNARNVVTISQDTKEGASYSICQNIDNFREHVLQGALNKRGWVLQEHALARRTIFFTEHQTYWECGCGVRCETMTHMKNELASLLGDPAFPNILSGVSLGQQIVHFQALYEQYSTLGLSKPMDRPTAIDSLQQRLLRTMKLRGGFGVFDGGDNKGLLRRSLLWYRNDPGSVVHIPELKTQVPTWSWMSHSSPIKYFEIEPNKYDWRDLTSPWASNAKDKLSIVGSAQRLDLGAATSGSSSKIIMDVATPLPPNSSGDKAGFEASQVSSSAMCIVLGNFRDDRPSTEQTHYFLIIEKSSSARVDENTYERIGAGFASGRCIHSDKIEVVIR